MRDHLHRATEIFTLALPAQHLCVNAAGGKVIVTAHAYIGKPLVMAKVQIGFRTIRRDEYLTMLNRAHGTGVNVDIGVHLQDIDPQLSGFQLR